MRETLDLGTLAYRPRASEPPVVAVFAAPSRWTRAVWALGAIGCLVFVWSVALPLGWIEPASGGTGLAFGRWPTAFESVFWLLPLLLAGLSVVLALGGVRLVVDAERVHIGSLPLPGRRRQERSLELNRLLAARAWEERSDSREKLYAIRLVFAGTEVVWRTADEAAWRALAERFEGAGL